MLLLFVCHWLSPECGESEYSIFYINFAEVIRILVLSFTELVAFKGRIRL